ncbi:CDP-glycerol--glycerophosphate glycerophosphotransferase [Polaribacter sp. Hel1_85]|uniref:CDP-glycerol--glycerophosphate glycerophosphotransferase n=1 Tax=Polaribacter sp. Hel1_85 TaxID=1250005 RepID=UPI00052B9F9E|nr:CDP-glycerol--glycerophosphate glycerophosphotransferase [Polaribacter sp. Hel1_85]KGL63090.1 CDP-glycerol:poly(glycerophosphate) glycerophosphotransferase [Polaribacter sp. Hel1_85]
MKTVLFCMNPYSFGILEPIKQVLKERNYEYIWFARKEVIEKFPFKDEYVTSNIREIIEFKSDTLFVPGIEAPHFLRGVKVQTFHGFAGEKKGHFRIRKYFDLYLTQGPFFTKKFNQLKNKFKDFKVVETGWPKLDIYGKQLHKFDSNAQQLKEKYKAKKIILFAPTFSPSLTCAPFLQNELEDLATNKNYLIVIKFHDLMSKDLINKYKKIAERNSNILFIEERNIIKYLLISDLMISDTSSVVYEFLLLDKPVITYKNNSKIFKWDNSLTYDKLSEKVEINLLKDPFKNQRLEIFNDYHPYNDGKSAERMVDAVEDYIEKHGIPERRKIPWLRRYKMNKLFGNH